MVGARPVRPGSARACVDGTAAERTSQRVAAIDCGTNSLRLLVADVDPAAGTLTDVDRRMRIVRLGQGVDATGRLAPEALERTLARAARSTPGSSGTFRPKAVRMVATSATRDAANAADFVSRGARCPRARTRGAQRRGGGVPVLPGATAEFAAAGAGRRRRAGPYLVVDIGGGSTEFVVGDRDAQDQTTGPAGSARCRLTSAVSG